MHKRYTLAKGTQVREEDFGLLFYQMNGPRLYFVDSGALLNEGFFRGEKTLADCIDTLQGLPEKNKIEAEALARALNQLTIKGVIVEC